MISSISVTLLKGRPFCIKHDSENYFPQLLPTKTLSLCFSEIQHTQTW